MAVERRTGNPVTEKLFKSASPEDKARLSQVALNSRHLVGIAASLLPPFDATPGRDTYQETGTFVHEENGVVTGIQVERTIAGPLDRVTIATQDFNADTGRAVSAISSIVLPGNPRDITPASMYDGVNRRNPDDLKSLAEKLQGELGASDLSLRDMGNLGRLGRVDQWQELRERVAQAREAARTLRGDLDGNAMEASQDTGIPDTHHERRPQRLLEILEP